MLLLWLRLARTESCPTSQQTQMHILDDSHGSCLPHGIELIPRLGPLGSTWIGTLAILAVFSVPHELLHALARRFFGYRAIPIPILFPPILGITVGPKPQETSEQAAAGLAPVLLTAATFLLYCFTINDRYLMLGLLNLFCTAFDVLPMVLPRRSRRTI